MKAVQKNDKIEIFENKPILQALAIMAIPTIISQLITLVYNIADLWFIGQTDNPYMVAATALVATIFLMATAVANIFGVGGGNLVVRLIGSGQENEAKKVASWSLVIAAVSAVGFSIFCYIFMNPMLYLLGASENTIDYARQYMLFVVVFGALPTVLSNVMSAMLRNVGYSKEAAFGLGLGGILNVILDPLFMFVIMPDGYEVVGAALATMLSNTIAMVYYICTYRKVQSVTILGIPRGLEKILPDSRKSVFSVGLPAASSLLLFDVCNMMINMLSSSHGDLELAAMGIVLKVERLPLNVGIGICLGMTPLVAYNYASKNKERMMKFFRSARTAGLLFALICVVLYRIAAPFVIKMFISDGGTVQLGTEFLRARCFATPFMFLSFHMVHFMQAIGEGKISFYLPVIRQLCLNIPMLLLLNAVFGMTGIVWTQLSADIINVMISYMIYSKVMKRIE
jgi:Na+-driven multidrug efflux pump